MAVADAPDRAETAILGDEEAVATELRRYMDAGAAEIWAMPMAVGKDPQASLARTWALLSAFAAR